MKLWLDDWRRPPDSRWYWAKTAEEAIYALTHYDILFASLDHDLGDVRLPTDEEHYQVKDGLLDENTLEDRLHKEQTGYAVVLWLAEHGHWPRDGIVVHSLNPVGAKRMCQTIDRYGPYLEAAEHRPSFEFPEDQDPLPYEVPYA